MHLKFQLSKHHSCHHDLWRTTFDFCLWLLIIMGYNTARHKFKGFTLCLDCNMFVSVTRGIYTVLAVMFHSLQIVATIAAPKAIYIYLVPFY